MTKLTIAIDGHSSCGKSTLAKELAKELKYTYVDTGAMYRAIALAADQHQLIKNNKIDNLEKFRELLKHIEISFQHNSKGQADTLLNNVNVESKIRTMHISNMVSNISSIGFVREKLVALQQNMGKEKGIVMDGRDIGTVVFPDAGLKIFLTASAQTRAQRRYDELIAKGEKVTFEEVLTNIQERDYIDENRDISPLRKAEDAITLDNSHLSREEQLNKVLELIKTL